MPTNILHGKSLDILPDVFDVPVPHSQTDKYADKYYQLHHIQKPQPDSSEN